MTTDTDLDALRAQTDPLIANLNETVEQVKTHDHPTGGGDLYCLNLTSYMGDRMPTVLRRLAAEQAEVDRLRAAQVDADEVMRMVEQYGVLRGTVATLVTYPGMEAEAGKLALEASMLRDKIRAAATR